MEACEQLWLGSFSTGFNLEDSFIDHEFYVGII